MVMLISRFDRRLQIVVGVALVCLAVGVLSTVIQPLYWVITGENVTSSSLEIAAVFRPGEETLKRTSHPSVSSVAATAQHAFSTFNSKQGAAVKNPAKDRAATPSRLQASPSEEGHGVASDPEWRHRQPRIVGEDETISEKAYLLNRDVVHALADKDRYIMVTWANDHYFDFVANWVSHVEGQGISSYIVGAMDAKILRRLLTAGIPCFAMMSGLTYKDFGWGSKNFHIMGRKKIKLIELFTELNVTVIISDVDTVWLRRPFEYMKRYPEADILTSSDSLTWTYGDEGLEDAKRAGAAYNIGIMLFSPAAHQFAKAWVARIEADENVWDQNAFNWMVRDGMHHLPEADPRGAKRLFLGAKGTLAVGVLPVATFASGQTFFVARLHEQLALEPYVVHATFQFSGTPGKRGRFREAFLWHDTPAYYSPAYGLLTWEPDVPEGLLRGAAPAHPALQCCGAQQGHFELVNHQLLQARHALAIASSLGLGVIIPQFVAGQERYWAPHAGRVPGSRTPLPYMAPLDHIFDLERGLGRSKDEGEFGPNIPIREHSFLLNARTPPSLTSSVLTVEVCEGGGAESGGGEAPCCNGTAEAEVHNGIARVRAGLSDTQWRTALGGVIERFRVVRFRSMLGAFSRHERDSDHDKFVKRTRIMTSIWCCVQPPPGKPGHVWYDMWWDSVPHTDRHGRLWNTPWHIVMGP